MQSLLLNAYALRLHQSRFGAEFKRLLASWEESQWWDAARIRELQDERVRSIVSFAASKVPFYGRHWAEAWSGGQPGARRR